MCAFDVREILHWTANGSNLRFLLIKPQRIHLHMRSRGVFFGFCILRFEENAASAQINAECLLFCKGSRAIQNCFKSTIMTEATHQIGTVASELYLECTISLCVLFLLWPLVLRFLPGHSYDGVQVI